MSAESKDRRQLLRNIICVLLLNSFILSAQDFEFEPVRPVIVSARTAGFGGSYSALEAGFDTLTTNPAALAYVDEEWSLASLSCKISGPLFDLSSVMAADDIATEILELVGDNNGVYIGADAMGPLSFGKVEKNFGFGIFNRTFTVADIPSITMASMLLGEEVLLVGGYGLNVLEKGPHSIAIGLQLKGFFQYFFVESGTAITLLNDALDFKLKNIPVVLSSGFGVDVGTMYRFGKHFSAAITCKDLYTPVFSTQYANQEDFMDGKDIDTDYDRLDPELNAGLVYSIPMPSTWSTITAWNIMFDYRDALGVFDTLYRNPILNLAFGTELVLLDVVSLRAGISDAYLSTGLGLNLTYFQIDFAMYGKELGLEPGSRPVLNIALSLAFKY